ncbi:MAG: biopolymer transporter ExbD [Acidobacteriota bacterium]|nr:biopolymer transporter ExbD [Blastocatellia bacterium]MDW8411918.1 biopolymer transporter ExbD [Acidobacteriota bacterium]
MAFNQHGRTRTSLSEINVTPLVDVMLVLLVIFMVTAPILQTGIQVNLPKTASSTKVEVPNAIILSVDKEGNVYLGSEKRPLNIRAGELQKQLQQKLATSNEKKVYVRGDGDTPYRVIAFVLAECKKVGAQVSLVTEPEELK